LLGYLAWRELVGELEEIGASAEMMEEEAGGERWVRFRFLETPEYVSWEPVKGSRESPKS
jgi:hypothetical protein